jgi:hypothetical protein
MSAIKCPPPASPPEIKEFAESPLANRIRTFFKDLSSKAGLLTDTARLELLLQQEYAIKAASVAHIPNIKNYNKIESTLAKLLGWKSWAWQALTETMTDAGAVRYAFLDRAELARNLIETATVYKILPNVRKLYEELKFKLPFLPEAQLQNLLYDHIVVGQMPKLYNIMDSPIVRDQLIGRYNAHIRKLQNLGLPPTSIQTLDELSGKISEAFDTLRAIAGREGLDIPTLENGGYFPLRAQQEAKKLFDEFSKTLSIKGSSSSLFDTDAFFLQARASHVPIVWKSDKLAKLLGMEELDLLDLAREPGALSALLESKLKPEQIEKLFESGVLVQAPALSDELTEFFNTKLDLPLQNLGEAIVLDPIKAIQDYANELKEAVVPTTLFKDLMLEGIEQGWILPSSLIKQNSRDYIRMGTNPLIREVFASSPDLVKEVEGLFIHRTVAEQFGAILQMNQSWADLGMLGQTIQRFVLPYTSLFRKSALLASPLNYIKRVVFQNAVSLYAATGSLSQLGIATAEVTRMMAKKSLEVFNKSATVTIGTSTYTLQELFEATMLKRGGGFISSTGEVLNNVAHPFEKLSLKSLQRFLLFNKAYHAKFGSPITGAIGTVADLTKEIISASFNSAYNLLAVANQHADFAARWAAIRTLAFEKGSQFTSIDDLIRHTDEFFQINMDPGLFGKYYGSIGMPFASFAMSAPGAAVRYALLYPWRAGRVLSLYAQAAQGSFLTDAEMAQWQKDNYVIAIARDHSTGKAYGVMPTSIDFYLDSLSFFRELAEDIGRSMGVPVGSVKEQIEQARDPLKPITDTLQELLSSTYISAAFPLFGLDPNTLEPIPDPTQQDTLIGVPLPSSIRKALVQLFPLLKSFDESLLPTSITGQARKTSPSFKQEQPGRPGWMGYTPTSGGKRKQVEASEPIGWFLQNVGGLSLSSIDQERNLVRNYEDFDKLQRELSGAINKLNKRLTVEKANMSEEEQMKLEEQRQLFLRLRLIVAYNKFLVDRLASERNLPKPSALKQLSSSLNATFRSSQMEDAKAFIEFYLQQQPPPQNKE